MIYISQEVVYSKAQYFAFRSTMASETISTLQYKASTLLMFLITHGEDDAEALGLSLDAVDKDLSGTLTIEGQKIIIKLNGGLTFTSKDKYDFYTRRFMLLT
jgi:hypothetical protein